MLSRRASVFLAIGLKRALGAMLFAAILMGCAVRQSAPPTQRVMLRGFSFVPAGTWEPIPRFKTQKAEFASRDADNLVWATADSFEVPIDAGSRSDKALDSAYSATVLGQVYGLGGHTQVIWSKSHYEEVAGARCRRSQTLLKAKATNVLLTSLLCVHPASPGYVVALDHTQKWPEQSWLRENPAEREAFLNSLQMGPLPESPETASAVVHTVASCASLE